MPELAAQGYIAVSRTETSAQMVRKKRFSVGWAFAWFLLFGVSVLCYLFYYMGKRDDIANLQEVNGQVTGSIEYTAISRDRLLMGISFLVLGIFLYTGLFGYRGGIIDIVAILVILGSFIFDIAALFGSRRHEQIGAATV